MTFVQALPFFVNYVDARSIQAIASVSCDLLRIISCNKIRDIRFGADDFDIFNFKKLYTLLSGFRYMARLTVDNNKYLGMNNNYILNTIHQIQ